jgi:hypothetical protein
MIRLQIEAVRVIMLAAYPLETFVLRYGSDIGVTTNNVRSRLKRKQAFGRFHEEVSDGDCVLHRHRSVSKRYFAVRLQPFYESIDGVLLGSGSG